MHLDEKKGTLTDPEAAFDAIISSGKYVIYFAKFRTVLICVKLDYLMLFFSLQFELSIKICIHSIYVYARPYHCKK